MPIVKLDNYIDAYRMRADYTNLHALAGRDGKEKLTEFANSQILQSMELGPDDVLVDIGCGDGRLLRKAEQVSQRVGIVPTVEEKTRLEREHAGICFMAGLVQKLPLASESATRIVCNGVLLLLKSEEEVIESLKEISRVATPNAKIWIGELPEVDEYARYRMYHGESVAGLLWFLLSNYGLRSFLGMVRRLLRAIFGKERIVLNSAGLYYATPTHFIDLACNCGLRLESYFKHREVDKDGGVVDSAYRYNYIFRK